MVQTASTGVSNMWADSNLNCRINALRALACDVAELHCIAEQHEVELRASEEAREQLEQRIEKLELEKDMFNRLASDQQQCESRQASRTETLAVVTAGLQLCVVLKTVYC